LEFFGGGVNEIPTSKTDTEWSVDPNDNSKRWMRFIRHYTWKPGPPGPGHWERHTTVELNEDGTVKAVTHP
jgi:hypothetical protein